MVLLINYMVVMDLMVNCVLFLNRHYFIVALMITPYAIFELMVPDLYQPIDIKSMLGINLPFHLPILTILMLVFSGPIFFILKFIQTKKLQMLGSPFDEILNLVETAGDVDLVKSAGLNLQEIELE